MIQNRRQIDPREYFKRPARRQITGDNMRTTPINDGTIYNIWYNRYTGGDKPRFSQIERSNTRCVLSRDAGKTKCRPKAFHCIHFARGCCSRGPDCQFIHNIPVTDTIDKAYDCFGRERHRHEKEDMSGVGSFEKENKTIYVGNVTIGNNMEEFVAKHFSEWGEIEHIRILQGRGIAFVRYSLRAVAEFAKEAMFGQSLDGNEILNVRWAQDDPNQNIQDEAKRKAEEVVYAAIEKNLPEVGELGSVLAYQGIYDDPVAKKVKLDDSKAQDAANDVEANTDYAQYYETFGNDAYAYQYEDNSSYAYKYDIATGQESAVITVESGNPMVSATNESGNEKSKNELGLVVYGSESDEEE